MTFILAHLDIRQESSRHADALNEILDSTCKFCPGLTTNYQKQSESAWLVMELQTRRPLIPAELPFSDQTNELISNLPHRAIAATRVWAETSARLILSA